MKSGGFHGHEIRRISWIKGLNNPIKMQNVSLHSCPCIEPWVEREYQIVDLG